MSVSAWPCRAAGSVNTLVLLVGGKKSPPLSGSEVQGML